MPVRIWFNKTFSTIRSVFNQLHATDRNLTVICTHTHSSASAFLSADEYYLEPNDLDDSDYLEWCVTFCQQHRINLFWVAKAAVLVGKNIDRFHAVGTKVVLTAAPEILDLLHNKAKFYATLPSHIAEAMDFIAVKNIEQFDQAIGELSSKHSKLCVKPAVSVFGLGFRILDTQPSIYHLLNGIEYTISLAELRAGMVGVDSFKTLLVMEHLNGHEWSVDCVGRHGELVCAVQRKKSLFAGHGQLIDNNPDIGGMVKRLTAHYQLNGIFNIQFKEGKNGVRLLEINPRPSGGFGMACLAGVNLAELALQTVLGETVTLPSLNVGLKISETNTPVVLKMDVSS